jgi:preprotein translocase subunit YajC
MTPFVASIFFAMAPAAGASPEDARRQSMMSIGMIVFMFVVMYVVVLRPQQKRAKEQTELLKALKVGDKVITASGIIGVVTSVRDDSVTIRSSDTKLEFQKTAITQITERAS